MIGYAFCGSFCTLGKSFEIFKQMAEDGKDLLPIVSENVWSTDTRFQAAQTFCGNLAKVSGHEVVHTIVDAEPLGPRVCLDMLIVSPCTGNTLAKIAAGITDTAVTMAVKAHLRSDRTVVIALASNDALSANLKNIAALLERKNVFFVPMFQDDPVKKPHSLVADFSRLRDTCEFAKNKKQIQKIFI